MQNYILNSGLESFKVDISSQVYFNNEIILFCLKYLDFLDESSSFQNSEG